MESEELQTLEERLKAQEDALALHYWRMGRDMLALAETQRQEIDRLTDEIVCSRLALSRLRGELPCPACETPNAPQNNFCRHCGVRLHDEPSQ